MYAAQNGLDDIAAKLLENEISETSSQSSSQKPIANVDFKDKDSMTALMYAAANGNKHILSLLIDNNANINVQNNENRTPLMCAAAAKQLDCLSYLLEKGAAVNIVDVEGNTALIYAAASGKKELVLKLLKYKANPLIKNLQNKSAADIAKAEEFNDIVDLLKKAAEIEKSKNLEKEKEKTTKKLATLSHAVMLELIEGDTSVPDLFRKEPKLAKNRIALNGFSPISHDSSIPNNTELRKLHPDLQKFYKLRKINAAHPYPPVYDED